MTTELCTASSNFGLHQEVSMLHGLGCPIESESASCAWPVHGSFELILHIRNVQTGFPLVLHLSMQLLVIHIWLY